MDEKFEKKGLLEVRDVLIKTSFNMTGEKGARVCYPNEVLAELFGKNVLDEFYIKE